MDPQTKVINSETPKPQLFRPPPVTPIDPGLADQAPQDVTDPALKRDVDTKLNGWIKAWVIESIGSDGPAVATLVNGLAIDWRALLGATVADVVRTVAVPELLRDPKLASIGQWLQRRRAPRKAKAPPLRALLHPDLPLVEHPLFVGDVRQGRTRELLRIVGLSLGYVERLDARGQDLEAWNDHDWKAAVDRHLLTASERDALFFVTEVSRLTGRWHVLVDAVRKKGMKSTLDLVGLDAGAWLQLVLDTRARAPQGLDPDVYADLLAKNVQRTYPSEYFSARIADGGIGERLVDEYARLEPLLRDNPDILQKLDGADVDWSSIDLRDRPPIEASLAEVARIVFTYRHLGLASVLADGNLRREDQAAEIARRIEALALFLRNNAALDLRFIDLLDTRPPEREQRSLAGTGLDWTGIDPRDHPAVRSQLLAWQRVLHLAPDHDTAMKLLGAGLDSSAAIGQLAESAFFKQSGLAGKKGKSIHQQAQIAAAQATNAVQAWKDSIISLGAGKYFSTVDPAFVDDLKDIAGWADMFGHTGYCDCEHCRSIFGPAAYFVDLMYFIQKNITNEAFFGKPKHPIRLNMRRPDLWTLPLTCDNTYTLIPLLQIVIEILESYIEKTLGIQDVEKALLSDRKAIGLPFHAPLARVREALSDWDLTLGEVYALLGAPEDARRCEVLGLSDEEWSALTAGPLDTDWIRFPSADHTTMDALDFLGFAGITRAQLDELRQSAVAGGFTIERVPTSDDIQSEKEVLEGLSDALNNRVGRLLRLARKTGYTITELDEVLTSPRIAGVSPLSNQALAGLARFERLRRALGLSVESLVGAIDHLPTRPLVPGAKSLSEQLDVAALTGGGPFPVTLHHAHFNTLDPADDEVDPRLPALLSVAGVTESDLLALFAQYPTLFPFDNQGDCSLTADGVALLYAHATLARAFRLGPADLSLIVARLLNVPSHDFRTLDLLEQLQQLVATFAALPFGVGELFALLDPVTAPIAIDQIVALVEQFQKSGAPLFTPTALTSLPSLTPDDAAGILAALTAGSLVEKQGDKYALAVAYAPGTNLAPSLPSAFAPRAAEIHAALMAFHFVNLLPTALAATVGLTVEHTLIALAFAQPGWDAPAILTALRTPIVNGAPTQPADLNPLWQVACDLARHAQLASRLGLDAADSWFVAQYPAVFGIADIRALAVADVAALGRYRQLLTAPSTWTAAELQVLLWQYHVRTHGNAPLAPAAPWSPADATAPAFAAALAAPEHAPIAPGAAPSFPSEALVASPLNAAEIARFAGTNGLDPTRVRSVFLSLALPAGAIDGFGRALALEALCRLLGTQGPTLPKLLVRDWAGLRQAADLGGSLLDDKYRDPAEREEKFAPHIAALNELTRDALCDFLIAREALLGFKSRSDLYAYFLVDVEVGGCFRTSRLVAAISSLQLYVFRCLVDLEQAKSNNLSVLALIDVEDVSREWEWRQNYRVWEANRKVFLYPENYIEPELRDNKSPLFEELEDDLLQRAITLDAAASAYERYLAGFSTLARLKTVGACFDGDGADPEKDCYWFLARTYADPYQYYLRRYTPSAKRWENWEKIELGIGSPYVSPVVHLGRLYLFWVDVSSMDKSTFVDGNSIFRAIEHHVIIHYSHRLESGKWAPAQKRPLDRPAPVVDRCVIDGTPPFIKDIANFIFFSVDKSLTEEAADFYRTSKTYAKLIATPSSDDAVLALHYLRKFERTDVEVVTAYPDPQDPLDPSKFTFTYDLVPDSAIDAIFFQPPSPGVVEIMPPNPAPSVEYYRVNLDLITNELTPVTDALTNREWVNQPTEQPFYDGSNGAEAIGLHTEPNPNDPDAAPSIALSLRRYAAASYPAATDDMLISDHLEGGLLLTNAISGGSAHDVIPVNQDFEDTVLQHWKHQHWIHRSNDPSNLGPKRAAIRINTTLDAYLSKALFTGGIEGFLTLATQTSQGETPLLFASNVPGELTFEVDPWGRLPFAGSFGDYYREIFFHIPFLIANQLNAQGQYKESKYWYEKIFNPTAQAPQNDPNVNHRVWQYFEFRDVPVQKLKDLLTDQATIEIYHEDPFNPHAIARLRVSAYMKSIVMKYVSNLVDWGDRLFTEFTMESVNEAIMLYVLALDILGPRPVSIGPCQTAPDADLTWEKLAGGIALGSEFLILVENIQIQNKLEHDVRITLLPDDPAALGGINAIPNPSLKSSGLDLHQYRRPPRVLGLGDMVRGEAPPPRGEPTTPGAPTVPGGPTTPGGPSSKPRPGVDIGRHFIPAFCVPFNEKLLALWDRIADRLFKIRHCLDIDGQHRVLALFAPPIDPALLVRAKAAGLSIEDIVGQQAEALPHYRFTYLVEKARQYVQTVQGFGGALLSALEKKDGEELALLRSTHEKNILALNRSVKKQQLDEAQAQLAAVTSQRQNVQNRVGYYTGLLGAGLTGWEATEQALKHTATALRLAESAVHLQAGIAYLVPQLGSPFAMKYGGKELGDSFNEFAAWASSLATISDAASGSAGLEATFQRRAQEWQQQLTIATEELNQLDKQVLAAEIRARIAEKDLEIHDQQLAHAQEIRDFLREKFTSTALYTYLSAQLMRLYREAYQLAAQVARQAERAYQFERDATDFFIQGDNWPSDRSGLLAGERLLVQLQRLEQAYLGSNAREIEVTQSFSLLQVDPGALENLQQNGSCTFKLPEQLFDMVYPGQYRRLLKSVRLTIPCVAGPYTNIGATLQLNGSQMRRDPKVGLVDVPLTMTSTIATSHAQNDAGVFELNFRDERYLPFEGAGAVSTWSLSLPSKVRMFNYDTVSDVVINLSYFAKYDGAFAGTVENGMLASLKTYSQTTGLFRLVSVRQEFPDAFYQLLNPAPGQPQQTAFTLESRHFPAWLHGQNLQLAQVVVYPRPVKGQTLNVNALTLKVAGSTVGGWSGGKGTAAVSGSPLRSWALDAGTPGFDKAQLDDLFLLLKYQIL